MAPSERLPSARPPSSIYRLQLGASMGFAEARRRLPYLRALGAEAVYLSPCMQAAAGSAHGYDVVDPNRLSDELGGEAEFLAMAKEAARLSLRLVLDWVPNHMSISEGNAWWMDVLENGPASPYARFFDIDWFPAKAELSGKVLLPLLPDLYGRVLDSGQLALVLRAGALRLEGCGRWWPIAPETYPLVLEAGLERLALPEGHGEREELLSILTALRNLPRGESERTREKEFAKRRLESLSRRSPAVAAHLASAMAAFRGRPGEPESFDRLHDLLDHQHYRLAHWKVASEEINYRRFFNINDLAALRMEEETVFRHCHQRLLRLVADGQVHGLRIDHIDGLYDPAGYLAKLQAACAAALAARGRPPSPGPRPFFIIVEKILEQRESLPKAWPVHGTVGYEFLNALGGLFVDPSGQARLDEAYAAFTGHGVDFDSLVYSTKKLFAAQYMASEVHALGYRLDALSEKSRASRDFTRYQLTVAIREIVECFPVYRSYVAPQDTAVSEADARVISIAVEKARRRTPEIDRAVYDFLADVLLLRLKPLEEFRDLALRVQQLTGPIMAKGLEDTAFYANSRLISLNEVGGDPARVGVSIPDFHKQNAERALWWPAGLLTTSTHDTKRSEDARWRIHALSELSEPWRAATARWSLLNAKHRLEVAGHPEPSGDTEYFIYQSLIGVWPDEPLDEAARAALLKRLWEHCLKAVREGRRHSNWAAPNVAYEGALRRFLEGLLEGGGRNRFLDDFLPLQARVAALGRWNSLAALGLKLASPGVVDVYQGCELWNFRLVDPDNRRPVDFDRAQRLLAEAARLDEPAAALLARPADAAIKLWVLHRGLAARRSDPGLFVGADYLPLRVQGERARHVVAFARRADGRCALAAAGRFFGALVDEDGSLAPEAWRDAAILLPASLREARLRDAYSGRMLEPRPHPEGAALQVRDAFATLPCVLLTPV